MPVTLDDLITPDTQASILRLFLTKLASLNWPVTNWGKFGSFRSLLTVEAEALSNLSQLVAKIARGGLLDLARGDWLTLLAKSNFDLDREAAVFTEGNEHLTCAPGNGPYNITPGQLWFKSTNGLLYNNTTGGTLTSSSPLDINIKAEQPGSVYNRTDGDITAMVTPLVGVTAINQPLTGNPDWTSVQGSDEEQDDELRSRCRTRWASLGAEKTRDAYVYLAKNVPAIVAPGSGLTQITKIYVDDTNPDGPGTIRIYLAGDGGGIAGATLTAADAWLQSHKGLCAVLTNQGAIDDTVTLEALVQCTGDVDDVIADLTAKLDVFQSSLDVSDGASLGRVRRAQLNKILMSPDTAFDDPDLLLLLNGAEVDIQPNLGHFAKLAYTISAYGGTGSIQVQAI